VTRALVFAPMYNGTRDDGSPKADAKEFRDEAHAFCRANRLRDEVILFDNRLDFLERRGALLARVHERPPSSLDALAIFCHGWPSGIQLGFGTEHTRGLAQAVKGVAAPSLTVALYCCSTGADNDPRTNDLTPGPGGDGGFADRLRDELCELGVAATVFAHANAGHCTRNPRARVFLPDERRGGQWVVGPDSDLWPAWDRALDTTDLRLRFPFMSREQVSAELVF
jgi:hypothetical protein